MSQQEVGDSSDIINVLVSIKDSINNQHQELLTQNRQVLSAISSLSEVASRQSEPSPRQEFPQQPQPQLSHMQQEVNQPRSQQQIQQDIGVKTDIKQVLQLQKFLPGFGSSEQQDADLYIQKLEYCRQNQGINDSLLLEAIGMTLEGQAGFWFMSNKFTSFQQFRQGFQQEFCAKQQIRQQQLFSLQLEKGETLEAFAKRVRLSCFKASVDEEQQIIGYFINGLYYRLKKAKGDFQTFPTLQDAVNYFSSVSQILYLANNQGKDNNPNTGNNASNNTNNTNNNTGNNRYNNNRQQYNKNYNNRGQNNNQQSNQQNTQAQNLAIEEQVAKSGESVEVEKPTISYDPASLFLDMEEEESAPIYYEEQAQVLEQPGVVENPIQQLWNASSSANQEQVLQAKKKKAEKEEVQVGQGKSPIDKNFDMFLQLSGQKASVSLLEFIFQEPQRSQLLQFLNTCRSFSEFQDAYKKYAQEQYFARVYKDNVQNAELQQREQTFQQQLASQNLQSQQAAQQQAAQIAQQQAQQQASQTASAQSTPMQTQTQHRYNTRNNPNPAMQYVSPYVSAHPVFSSTALPNQVDIYNTFVSQNSQQPDFQKCIEVTGDQKTNNKYLAVVCLQQKLAIAQIDSGSFYTVVSQSFVNAYGLANQVQPSTKKYSTVSGQSTNFVGQIPNIQLQFGRVVLRITLQITGAGNYSLLLGQDTMLFLLLDLLTSQQKFCYFDSKREAHFIPAYRHYENIPENIIKQIQSFQGLPKWITNKKTK